MTAPVTLTDRELATVLAALRYWQLSLHSNPGYGPRLHTDLMAIATDGGASDPLTALEIDAICERLNR